MRQGIWGRWNTDDKKGAPAHIDRSARPDRRRPAQTGPRAGGPIGAWDCEGVRTPRCASRLPNPDLRREGATAARAAKSVRRDRETSAEAVQQVGIREVARGR